MIWNIETYKTASGREIVREFILKMQPTTQGKLIRLLEQQQRALDAIITYKL